MTILEAVLDVPLKLAPLPCCKHCLLWKEHAENVSGECQSMYFNEMVWGEFGGRVFTKPLFVCGYFEVKDGDKDNM